MTVRELRQLLFNIPDELQDMPVVFTEIHVDGPNNLLGHVHVPTTTPADWAFDSTGHPRTYWSNGDEVNIPITYRGIEPL